MVWFQFGIYFPIVDVDDAVLRDVPAAENSIHVNAGGADRTLESIIKTVTAEY